MKKLDALLSASFDHSLITDLSGTGSLALFFCEHRTLLQINRKDLARGMMVARGAMSSRVAAPAAFSVKNSKRGSVKQSYGGEELRMGQVATPVGPLSLGTSSDGLRLAYFDSNWWDDGVTSAAETGSNDAAEALMREAKAQVHEYFAGHRREFTIPLTPEGTSFQKKAWAALGEIQYGETQCYEEQAMSMAEPGKARAVGGANGKNPICLFIPCHRVIAKGGGLCGFASGLKIKQYLIDLESGKLDI